MNFKELLKANYMTCARLARKLGVSRALVSLWATGKGRPSVTVIPILAEILAVSVEEIVNCFA